jgi:hypothetical protein
MWGNIAHHPNGDKRNGIMAWSIVAGWRGPACCVIMVATVRQPTRGPVSVVSLHQVEVVLHRHGGKGSRMAVIFPMRAVCIFQFPDVRSRLEVLGDSMSVDVWWVS